ncbi:MAG: chemotaxis protein CheD [Thermodesulfobacteriota bacterium]
MGENLQTVILKPAELHVAFSPCRIVTVLGSCVAVCLYDEQEEAGAMCHCIFPEKAEVVVDRPDFSYVDVAVRHMAARLRQGGAVDLRAKLFGGADVIEIYPRQTNRTVGARNVAAARQALMQHGIALVAQRTGGLRGYRVAFLPHCGRVSLSLLERRGDPNG